MLQYDRPVDPWLTEIRCFSRLTQRVVIKTLGSPPIFFPPSSKSTHIMSRWSYHRQIGGLVRIKELFVQVFRHALYFKAEYSQLFHDIGHTSRHHAQVFTAHKHIGGFFQKRQLLHGFSFPEIILSPEKIVYIHCPEFFLDMRYQVFERGCFVHRNTKVKIQSPRSFLFEEKYIRQKIK